MRRPHNAIQAELRRLLSDAVQSQCGAQVKWRASNHWHEAQITLPLFGGLTGTLNFWGDGLVTGRLESLFVVPPSARDQVKKILTRENVRNGCMAWELIRRSRLAIRVKGIRLRGSSEKQTSILLNEVFKRLDAVHRTTTDWFVSPDQNRRHSVGEGDV